MTLKEFYTAANGNYQEIMSALVKEDRILRYLHKFADAQMNTKIKSALNMKDYETAFNEAHNLKGMSLNMALTKMIDLSSNLTESLRNGPTGQENEFFKLVETEYIRICELINQL